MSVGLPLSTRDVLREWGVFTPLALAACSGSPFAQRWDQSEISVLPILMPEFGKVWTLNASPEPLSTGLDLGGPYFHPVASEDDGIDLPTFARTTYQILALSNPKPRPCLPFKI